MTAESLDDPDLLRRMRLGDEAALEALYARYGGLLYTLAVRIVGDRELAREVVQDTFLRSWDGRETYDEQRGRVSWWLMGIARNRAIDLLRSRSHQQRIRERAASREGPAASAGDLSDTVSERVTVLHALRTLSDAQRTAIELAYYQGLTQMEIAEQLGQPLGTVKGRIREAMERLRGLLSPVLQLKGGPQA